MSAATTTRFHDWDVAYAAFLAASNASDQHWEMVEEPAVLELERRAPRPPKTFSIPARSGQVRTFEFDPAEPDKWDGTGRQFADAVRPLKAQCRPTSGNTHWPARRSTWTLSVTPATPIWTR